MGKLKESFTKEEVKAACDELVAQGILKVVGYEANGDPIYQETDAARESSDTGDGKVQ